ncbi:MAG: hypothetical protein WD011_02590, partial [Nitriliruptoraceae bacterium]
MSSRETAAADAGRRRLNAARAALYLVILLLLVPFVFPLWWMISSSLKSSAEVFAFPPVLWPDSPQWSNYSR